MKTILLLLFIILTIASCKYEEVQNKSVEETNTSTEVYEEYKFSSYTYVQECTGECKKTPVDSRYGILVVNDDLCRCKPTTLQQKEVSSGMGFPINY